MKPKPKFKSPFKEGSSLRSLKNWIPKTALERRRENRELDRMDEEMKVTVSGLSPEMQDEIGTLSNSQNPRDAANKLIDHVVSKDQFDQRRKDSRRGGFRLEGRLREDFYWIAIIPVLFALYCILSYLFTGHVRFK